MFSGVVTLAAEGTCRLAMITAAKLIHNKLLANVVRSPQVLDRSGSF